MTVMTKEQIEALLDECAANHCGNDLARTALALHQQLANAKAAQAMVVERAAEIGADIAQRTRPDGFPEEVSNAYHSGAMDIVDAILSIADTDGLALVQALRAERGEYKNLAIAGNLVALEMRTVEADRDRLAAANAALEAQVARMVGAVKEYHLALDRRQNGNTAGYRLQDEIQRILDMPWRQGATLAEVQADARREGGE